MEGLDDQHKSATRPVQRTRDGHAICKHFVISLDSCFVQVTNPTSTNAHCMAKVYLNEAFWKTQTKAAHTINRKTGKKFAFHQDYGETTSVAWLFLEVPFQNLCFCSIFHFSDAKNILYVLRLLNQFLPPYAETAK